MGKQDGGGALKDVTPDPVECKICGRRKEDDLLLCDRCRSNEGRTLLNVGDLPHIFVLISIILLFTISYSGKGEVFWIKGFDIDISFFMIIIEILSFIIVAFNIFQHRELFRVLRRMREMIISIIPLLVAIPLILVLTRGFDAMSITISTVLIPLLIISIVTTRRLIERKDLYWIISANLIIIVFGYTILESINGNQDFLSIEFISNPLLAGLSVPILFLLYIRFFKELSINIRHLAFITTMVLTIIFVILSYNIQNIADMNVSAALWSVSIVLFVIHISTTFVRRSVDDMLNRTLISSKHHMNEFDNFGRSGERLYQLHHLDMIIHNNPVHGLGDNKEKGNVVFSIGGNRGDTDLEGEVDEFVEAHCEKAMLLASKGKFPEAISEYKAAVSRNPEIYRTYYLLAMVQATMPGKEKDVEKNLKLFFKSRRIYIDNMIETGLPARYIYVFNDLYEKYLEAIDKKINLLNEIGRSGDIWSYFTLMRD